MLGHYEDIDVVSEKAKKMLQQLFTVLEMCLFLNNIARYKTT